MAPVNSTSSIDNSSFVTSNTEEIPLGEYLFLRIAQANPQLKSIFGVPGDFNLSLLEHLYCDSVYNDKQIRFINLCNELNAAYAADGYSKVIKGLSVLITTLGVGELSAINGVAGSFAEYAPVLHIVGNTSSRQQNLANDREIKNYHHLVQNANPLLPPNHFVYQNMVKDISVAQENLSIDDDINTIFKKIDHVLIQIIENSRPGYLFVPSDLSDLKVPKVGLSTPLQFNNLNNINLLNDATNKILSKVYASKNPSILADTLVSRFNYDAEFNTLISKLPSNYFKLFNTNMGRVLDDNLPNVVGTYYGKLSADKQVQRILENETDLLINFGFFNGETNTAGYSWNLSKISNYIEIHPDYIKIDNEVIHVKNQKTGSHEFSLGHLIDNLIVNFKVSQMKHYSPAINNISHKFEPKVWTQQESTSQIITQDNLIDFFNGYLRPNDILIVETCTFLFAITDLKFPPGVSFFSQNFYGSIGYALPATLGASIASKDLKDNRRIILVQGDGSAQMTIQELSSYLRFEINPPQIFLLNNSGYTVERIIKGPTRSYNDIQDTWNWTSLFKVFGDEQELKHESLKIDQLNQLIELNDKPTNDKIKFIELIMGKLDAPERFNYVAGQKPMPVD